MAVLIRHRVAGMTPSQYDAVSPPLIEKLKTQLGFKMHVAFVDNGKFTVSEIWRARSARPVVRRERQAEHPGR